MSNVVELRPVDQRECSFCGQAARITVRSSRQPRVRICGDCALKALRVAKDEIEMLKIGGSPDVGALFPDPLGHSAWIKANPDRLYRITPTNKPIGWGLVTVEVMQVSEDRHSWGMSEIYMRPEIPDTDDGAKIALKEEPLIFQALMRQARGGTRHIDELLAMLRGQSLGAAQ